MEFASVVLAEAGVWRLAVLGWRASLHHLQDLMVRQLLRYKPAACFQAAANQGRYKSKETACWLICGTWIQSSSCMEQRSSVLEE